MIRALALAATIAVVTAIATSPVDAAPVPGDLGDGNALLAPISHQNLTLLPVVATGPVSADAYLTLDEGMRGRKVRIGEIEDGDVNALEITNRSELPLFVMAGEVVLGGKQDRIIGKNTVVPPRSTQSIPVFCVEHGRWSGRKAEFSSAGALAHNHLRAKASFDGQGEVWSEVKSKNAKRRTDNATDTYRRVAVQQASGTMASWERTFTRAIDALPATDRARLVGYAVALNGQVVAVDVFGAPGLFGKLHGKLLRSYITEAIDEPIARGAAAPSAADVIAFVTRAEAAPAQKVYESSEAETMNAVGDAAASTRVMKKGDAGAKPVFKSAHTR